MAGSVLVPGVRSKALGACALALVLASDAHAQKGGKASQKEISKELRELYQSDQRDQQDPAASGADFGRRQKERRDRVMEIIAAGMLSDMQDWDCATLLLQHGQSADDTLLAHVLSVPPGIAGQPSGRFLCAATLDRYLQETGRAQIFTTQSGAADPSVYAPLEPFDDSMSESLRALFELKPLPGKADRESGKGKGKPASAKDLPKYLKLASTEPGSGEPVGGDKVPEWLRGTRELVLAGALKSAKDFDLAARTLLASSDPADLLSAHVLAMCAAFDAKNPESRALCAESLDRLLHALGRPQLFDTLRVDGAPKEPRAPLPAFILREYGLKPPPAAR